mgnify:CR=1 FL=1
MIAAAATEKGVGMPQLRDASLAMAAQLPPMAQQQAQRAAAPGGVGADSLQALAVALTRQQQQADQQQVGLGSARVSAEHVELQTTPATPLPALLPACTTSPCADAAPTISPCCVVFLAVRQGATEVVALVMRLLACGSMSAETTAAVLRQLLPPDTLRLLQVCARLAGCCACC